MQIQNLDKPKHLILLQKRGTLFGCRFELDIDVYGSHDSELFKDKDSMPDIILYPKCLVH